MPVRGMHTGERPDYSLDGQTARNRRILRHVRAVVIIDELMPKRLAKNEPNNHSEKETNANDNRPIARSGRDCFFCRYGFV